MYTYKLLSKKCTILLFVDVNLLVKNRDLCSVKMHVHSAKLYSSNVNIEFTKQQIQLFDQ